MEKVKMCAKSRSNQIIKFRKNTLLSLCLFLLTPLSSCKDQVKDNLNISTYPSIIGEWSTSGSILANYVNSGGRYVGDASTSSNMSYKFGADGKYEDFSAFTQGYKTHTFYYRGNYIVNGNKITTTPTFYEHKINTKLQPKNELNSMKKKTFNYAFEKNESKNVWGLRLKGDNDNYIDGFLYTVK
jgi:hypothetical protein